MANRYASQQVERSPFRVPLDAALACAPMTSLVTGLGLGAAGYLLDRPAIAAGGTLVAAVGLYVERLQARALRRRRRAERMRNRHEVTELRRTIAQLREEVVALRRALLDTEATFSVRPVPAQVAAPVAAVVPAAAEPAAELGWFQTADRGAAVPAPLPPQRPSPFVAAVSGPIPLPVLDPLTPRAAPPRLFDTGGIPVLDPVPHDELTATSDALVFAALGELGAPQETPR